jgi:Flp pilus assembly protein TadD
MFRVSVAPNLILFMAFSLLALGGCSGTGVTKSPRESDLFPSSLTSKPSDAAIAAIQLSIGQNAERNGDLDLATKAYQRAMDKDDTRFQPYHRLAILNDKRGDSVTAATLYSEAVRRATDVPELYCDWGYNCYLRGEWAEAESHFRTALQLSASFARAHNNLAMLLARLGKTEEAFQEFARAGATEAEARSNVAFAMMLEGQLEPAKQQLAMAQKLSQGAVLQVSELKKIAEIAAEVAPQRRIANGPRRAP